MALGGRFAAHLAYHGGDARSLGRPEFVLNQAGAPTPPPGESFRARVEPVGNVAKFTN